MNSNYYIDFENKFRGSREKIIDRLSIYDQLIKTVISNYSFPKLLDIGCGRGEFLEKWTQKGISTLGIECDNAMIKLCRQKGLNVIDGNAINILKRFDNNSFDLICIFHMVEHLDNPEIFKLFKESFRVLTNDGVILIETPSIDSLLVSSKSFYLDPTHINHIHPESLRFTLEQCGFEKAKYYHINGGPLQKSNPLKMTRILNGVGQDLFTVATKSYQISQEIFSFNKNWEDKLGIAPTTLEAAVDFDLLHENELNKINLLTNENNMINKKLDYISTEFKYLFLIIKILKKIKRLLVYICKVPGLIFFYFISKVFKILLHNEVIRKIFFSRIVLRFVEFSLSKLQSILSSKRILKIQDKINKINLLDDDSIKFNRYIDLKHTNSVKSHRIKEILKNKFKKGGNK